MPEEMFGDEDRPPDEHQWPYLIEVVLPEPFGKVDWGAFTQMEMGQPRSNWQAAMDEKPIEGTDRATFFFHCIQWDVPLTTPYGDFTLPRPTPMPSKFLEMKREYFWD